MHLETSISLAMGVSWRPGAGTVDAERRTMSWSPNWGFCGSTLGLGTGGNITASLSCHRSGDGLDIDEKRLVFRRLDVGVADEGRQRIRPEALSRFAGESPVQGNADDMDRLAVANELA